MPQKKEESLQLPEDFYLLAADFSFRRPGFCFARIHTGSENIFSELTTSHLDFKKTDATPGCILRNIYLELKRFADIANDFYVPIYLVREKAFNSRGSMYEISIFKVVGVSDMMADEHATLSVWDELYPTTVKKMITGNGKATKEEVAAALTYYLGERDYPVDDESDAAAVAVAWLIKNGIVKQREFPKEETKPDATSIQKLKKLLA